MFPSINQMFPSRRASPPAPNMRTRPTLRPLRVGRALCWAAAEGTLITRKLFLKVFASFESFRKLFLRILKGGRRRRRRRRRRSWRRRTTKVRKHFNCKAAGGSSYTREGTSHPVHGRTQGRCTGHKTEHPRRAGPPLKCFRGFSSALPCSKHF